MVLYHRQIKTRHRSALFIANRDDTRIYFFSENSQLQTFPLFKRRIEINKKRPLIPKGLSNIKKNILLRQNQHRISIRQEAVFVFDGFVVGMHDEIVTTIGCYTHQQCTFRLVEIGDE